MSAKPPRAYPLAPPPCISSSAERLASQMKIQMAVSSGERGLTDGTLSLTIGQSASIVDLRRAPMVTGATCMLRIVRRSEFADVFRSYKIFINGTAVGSIAHDSVLDLEVPSGPLTIEARVDWGRSRPLAIEAVPGKKIEIEVSNHWGALLSLWAVTFGYRSYLMLKQLPAP
jgi:hypothetical protein